MREVHVAQKAVLVRADSRLLALRRSKTDPTRPLTWDLPGGEVEFGEDLAESIKREVREEAGISLPAVTLLDVLGWINPEGEYWISIGYTAEVPQDAQVTLSFEHDRFEWLSPEEFLTRDSSERIKRYLAKLSSNKAPRQEVI